MHKDRSLRALLREATHDQHIRLHKHPLLATIMQPNYQLSDYHRLLLAYFGLYQFVEARIQQYLNNETVNFSYQERYKLPWLVNDLAFFHIKPLASNNLSLTVRDFPHITSLGQLVGILYVLEGSTLGASYMSLKLAEQHSMTSETGIRFFSGYGDNTQRYWQQFIAFSDTLSGDIPQCQEALKAACQTFELFSAILDQALPQHQTLAS
jgi:heme oxygenase (biliverdin-IX-beta and delta-forming)